MPTTGLIDNLGRDLGNIYLMTDDPNWLYETIPGDEYYIPGNLRIDKKFASPFRGYYRWDKGGGNYTGLRLPNGVDMGSYLIRPEQMPGFANSYTFSSPGKYNIGNYYPFTLSNYMNALIIGGGGGGGEESGGGTNGDPGGRGGALLALSIPIHRLRMSPGTHFEIGVGGTGGGKKGASSWKTDNGKSGSPTSFFINYNYLILRGYGGEGGRGGGKGDGSAGGIYYNGNVVSPKVIYGNDRDVPDISLNTVEYWNSFYWTNSNHYGRGGDGGSGGIRNNGQNGYSGAIIFFW